MCALPLPMALWLFLCAAALCLFSRSWGAGAAQTQVMGLEQSALLPSKTGNEATFRRQASHIESAANLHPARIERATKVHPTSLSV